MLMFGLLSSNFELISDKRLCYNFSKHFRLFSKYGLLPWGSKEKIKF